MKIGLIDVDSHNLQRWCNNRFLYHSCKFFDYVPRSDGKSIRELYAKELVDCEVM